MDDSLCLCHLLKAAAAVMERELNDALSDLGISNCQASVLVNLLRSGPLAMSAVSRELCCHKSNVTQVVDGLASKGLVSRIGSEEDRRVSMLSLTAKGKALAAKAESVLGSRAHMCVECFTPKERVQFAKLLEKSLKGHRA